MLANNFRQFYNFQGCGLQQSFFDAFTNLREAFVNSGSAVHAASLTLLDTIIDRNQCQRLYQIFCDYVNTESSGAFDNSLAQRAAMFHAIDFYMDTDIKEVRLQTVLIFC